MKITENSSHEKKRKISEQIKSRLGFLILPPSKYTARKALSPNKQKASAEWWICWIRKGALVIHSFPIYAFLYFRGRKAKAKQTNKQKRFPRLSLIVSIRYIKQVLPVRRPPIRFGKQIS